jgi:hypothetical protein
VPCISPYRNQSFLLSDIFGVLAAYGLTIHNLSLYGQIHAPMLVFIKLVVSRGGSALPPQTAENVRRAIREALAGNFEVEEMLTVEFNLDSGLEGVATEFYVDPVFSSTGPANRGRQPTRPILQSHVCGVAGRPAGGQR